MSMRQVRFDNPDEVTLSLAGQLTFANVAAAWSEGQARLRDSHPRVLDLAAIESADSAGLACILALLAEGRARQPDLCIRHAPESMRALARVSDAEHWLTSDATSGPSG